MTKKKFNFACIMIVLCNLSYGQQLKTKEDSAAYAYAYQMGQYFKQQQIDLNINAMSNGLVDGYSEKKSAVNPQELEQLVQLFNMYAQQQVQAKMEKESGNNKEIGRKFLEKNKKKKDIVETSSGLQYQVIKEGNGTKPTETDKVKVHYVGTLLDGTIFDSSRQRGEPIVFGLNQVIKGWTEGVQLMTPGSIYKFWIPSELAYGDRNIGNIPAGSTLVFEVELLEVNPQ